MYENIAAIFIILLIPIVFIAAKKNNYIQNNYTLPKRTNNGINRITNRIYLSNYKDSLNYEYLKSLGIKQILSVGLELPPHKTNEFKKMHLKLDDIPTEHISKHFGTAHAFMSRDVTLVHCYAGISRSATIVISYLIRHHRLSLEQALEHCRKCRPIVNPNRGFIAQLRDYENRVESFQLL